MDHNKCYCAGINLNYEKFRDKRKVSRYWQEVSQLFTRAGAFGIVNLFNHQQNNDKPDLLDSKAINHHKAATIPQPELVEDKV